VRDGYGTIEGLAWGPKRIVQGDLGKGNRGKLAFG